jgi:ArsR family transcriptional regulator
MDIKRENKLKKRTKILKALAHPSRLLIVEELAKKDRCVFELREMIGSDVSTVSKHLSVLKNAEIIIDSKKGLNVFYKLNICCIVDFFECIEKIMKK